MFRWDPARRTLTNLASDYCVTYSRDLGVHLAGCNPRNLNQHFFAAGGIIVMTGYHDWLVSSCPI